MASEEEILSIFDCYWFEYKILTSKTPLPAPEPNPVLETNGNSNLSSIPTFHSRSFSDHCLSSTDIFSPKSVLNTPKLQTIFSGEEVREFSDAISKREEANQAIKASVKKTGGEIKKRRRKQGRVRGNSKSLSELEFEELKGFMDLGFVFSEEDKNSNLVSIIPGLQRLGRTSWSSFEEEEKGEEKEEEEDEVNEVVEVDAPRPYLSEAWDPALNSKVGSILPVMDWRIPSLGNEVEVKDQLRIWAQTVASTVR